MSTLVQSLFKKTNFYQERNYEKNRETTAATLESSCQNNSSNSDRAVVKSSENNFETLWTLMIKKEIMKRRKKNENQPKLITQQRKKEIIPFITTAWLSLWSIIKNLIRKWIHLQWCRKRVGRLGFSLPGIWEFSWPYPIQREQIMLAHLTASLTSVFQ